MSKGLQIMNAVASTMTDAIKSKDKNKAKPFPKGTEPPETDDTESAPKKPKNPFGKKAE